MSNCVMNNLHPDVQFLGFADRYDEATRCIGFSETCEPVFRVIAKDVKQSAFSGWCFYTQIVVADHWKTQLITAGDSQPYPFGARAKMWLISGEHIGQIKPTLEGVRIDGITKVLGLIRMGVFPLSYKIITNGTKVCQYKRLTRRQCPVGFPHSLVKLRYLVHRTACSVDPGLPLLTGVALAAGMTSPDGMIGR